MLHLLAAAVIETASTPDFFCYAQFGDNLMNLEHMCAQKKATVMTKPSTRVVQAEQAVTENDQKSIDAFVFLMKRDYRATYCTELRRGATEDYAHSKGSDAADAIFRKHQRLMSFAVQSAVIDRGFVEAVSNGSNCN